MIESYSSLNNTEKQFKKKRRREERRGEEKGGKERRDKTRRISKRRRKQKGKGEAVNINSEGMCLILEGPFGQ